MALSKSSGIALLAFAALVAGAFSLQCYTVSSNFKFTGSNTATIVPTVDPVTTYKSCATMTFAGDGTIDGVNVKGNGKLGGGTECTCLDWASPTGCNGVTKTRFLADLMSEMKRQGFQNPNIDSFSCCDSNSLCNVGLGITVQLSSASLPLANLLTLAATALMGYLLAARVL